MPATPQRDPVSLVTRRTAWTEAALIVLATCAAYANGLDASFHFDDHTAILGNEALRDLGAMWPPSGARWIGDLTFALNYRLGRFDVVGYHVVNVLVHVANALLLQALARRMLRAAALGGLEAAPLVARFLPATASVLFALHPLATQAVTYVCQRYTSLATLFFMGALTLHLSGRIAALEGGRRSAVVTFHVLSLGAAVLAMRTKEIAFTLPLVAALVELVLLPGRARRFLLVLPLAAAAGLVPLAHLAVRGDLAALTAETQRIPRIHYLLTQTHVVATYVRLVMVPVGQNFDHDHPLSTSPGDPRVLGALALHAAILGGALLLLVRARRGGRSAGTLASLGVAWFYLTLSVESSIIPISDVIFEHRVYLPGVGAALALGVALLRGLGSLLPRAGPATYAAALLVVAAPLGVATWARNRVWHDDVSLWSDVVAKSPRKARPHNHLGIAYGERGELDAAAREFLAALALEPSHPHALINLGEVFLVQGALADAEQAYLRAVAAAPRASAAHVGLAEVHEAQGRLEEAIREYREALRLAPGDVQARAGLARALAGGGR